MSIAYKENGVWKTVSGIPPIDGALSSTSENPVQNKIVTGAVNNKLVDGEIADNADLNTIIKPGFYRCHGDSTNITNKPSGIGNNCFSLTVQAAWSNQCLVQELSYVDNYTSATAKDRVFRRVCRYVYGYDWKPWVEMPASDHNHDDRYYTEAEENQIIDGLQTKVSKTEVLISIIENGNTCTHTGGIAQGQYVNWKGNLYTADSNISVGTTFASSGGSKNLTAVSDGGLNDLKESLDGAVEFNTISPVTQTAAFTVSHNNSWRYGKFVHVELDGYLTLNYSENDAIVAIRAYLPSQTVRGFVVINTSNSIKVGFTASLSTDGIIRQRIISAAPANSEIYFRFDYILD